MLTRLVFAAMLLLLVAGGGFGISKFLASRQPLPRATALLDQRDPRGAQLILRQLVRTEPRNAEGHVLLGRTQLDLNDPVAAEKEFKIARALRYERAVLHPLLARAYIMQQRYQDILTDIPGTAAREEELVPNLAMRALAYLFMGDVRLAELTLAPALRMAPDDGNVLLARTRLLLARGELPQASASAAQLLAHNPSNIEALMLEGEVLERRSDAEGALASMNKAVSLAPYWVPARLQRANHLMNMGRNKEAQADIDASFEVDWHDGGVQLANAVLMTRNGRYMDAATEFQRMGPLMDRFPKSYYYQALNASLQDHSESALEMVFRYLKIAPSDQDALRLAGALESRLGRPERAVDYLSRATEAGLRDAETFDLLGRAQFILGRTRDAIENYRRATAMEPNNKDYAAHLAAAESLSSPIAVPSATR